MASTSNVTLEDLEHPIANTDSPPLKKLDLEDHLSYPTHSPAPIPVEPELQYHDQPRTVLKDRLYIGNLHPSVDEYSLLHVFSKFGKVTKLDFLFHKSGALKGKPRGYAFIEYGSQEEAQKALTMAHDKLLRGRKLIVTFAHQAPLDQYGNSLGPAGSKHKKTMMDIGRPTTLSMIKTGLNNRHEPKTADKIAQMEAKLRQLEASKRDESSERQGSGASTSTLPFHPSLPMKPPPPLPAHIVNAINPLPGSHSSRSRPPNAAKPKSSLPSLPILPPSARSSSDVKSDSRLRTSAFSQSAAPKLAKPRLAGVVIKPKAKSKEDHTPTPIS